MISALTISMKKPQTSGTITKARCAAPCCCATVVILAMAVAVEPSVIPPNPAEITAASQEQSAGIEQVNLTITQMDESTQQNAALVEEATAAARELQSQAGTLTEAVSVFRQQEPHEVSRVA